MFAPLPHSHYVRTYFFFGETAGSAHTRIRRHLHTHPCLAQRNGKEGEEENKVT